ncbi:MAG: type II secretion system F family protein [Betaproteobacteria bacterium HGW-Betaproteobacteria-8]|nr:MAG: type II secretion system F family protein [Betaproteobacteria bacterium HGW-Betaproteobacteria-8]
MAKFKYIAVDAQGKERKGVIEAEDSRSATAALRQQSLFVAEIEQEEDVSSSGLSKEVKIEFLENFGSVPTQDIIFFFKQMSFMLRAGLPVLHALEMSSTQVSSKKLRKIIREVVQDLENGMPLSMAMGKHPKTFPDLTVTLIYAGESVGELELVMDRIAEHIDKNAALKMQTINALIYPVIVVLAAIGVFIFLVIKIIPAFGKFFQGRGQALPPSTQFLLDLSAFMINYGLYILGAVLLAVVGIAMAYRTRKGKLRIHDLLLRMPVIGKLLTTAIMAQLNWSLGMLLRSGLTALEALKISGKVVKNRVISDKLHAASEQILSGKDLSSSLRHPRIPSIVTAMIAVGERSGTLDQVLGQLGAYYEERLAMGIKRLSSMIEPALILVIGAMVGFVYYAFFQALFQIAKT